MAKRKVSRIAPTAEETTTLIGISCNDNDYRVCWDINNLLALTLARAGNAVANAEKNEFSLYSFNDEDNNMRYFLTANKGSKGYLSEAYKKIDFFIIIIGTISSTKTEKIISGLKKSQIISAAFLLPAKIVKPLQLPL